MTIPIVARTAVAAVVAVGLAFPALAPALPPKPPGPSPGSCKATVKDKKTGKWVTKTYPEGSQHPTGSGICRGGVWRS